MGKGAENLVAYCCIYPIVAMVKAAIVFPFVCTYLVVANVVGAILHYPFVLLTGFYSVLVTQHLGPTAKFLAVLLCPVPLVTWPAFVALGAVMASIGISFFFSLAGTFDDRDATGRCCCGGVGDIIKCCVKGTADFYKFMWHTVYDNLCDYRNDCVEHLFDVPVHYIIVGLVVAVIGMVFDTFFITIIVTFKFFPMMLRGWFLGFQLALDANLESICLCGIPWAVGMFLIPVVACCGYGMAIMGATLAGLGSCIVAHERGLGEGFKYMWKMVAEFDEFTSKVMCKSGSDGRCCPSESCCDSTCYDVESSCNRCGECNINCCPRQQPTPAPFGGARPDLITIPPHSNRHVYRDPIPIRVASAPQRGAVTTHADSSSGGVGVEMKAVPAEGMLVSVNLDGAAAAAAAPPPSEHKGEHKGEEKKAPPVSNGFFSALPIQRIWDNVFTMSELHVREALQQSTVTRAEVDRQDKFLFRAIPTLTITRAIHRTIMTGTPGVLLADGIEVNEANRPRNAIGDLFYAPVIACKAEFAAFQPPLDEREIAFLERAIFVHARQAEDPKFELPSGFGEFLEEARRKLVIRLANLLLELGTRTSRLPQFRRRFEEILTRAPGAGGGAGGGTGATSSDLARQPSTGPPGAPGGPPGGIAVGVVAV